MSKNEEFIREAASCINSYVKDNGNASVMKKSDIEQLLQSEGVINETRIQISDLCYNRSNVANFQSFDKDCHLFERLEHGYYRILGEKYPYTGMIFWKQKGQSEDSVIGEWFCGNLIRWNPKEWITISEYNAKEAELVNEISEFLNQSDAIGIEKESLVKIRVNQSVFRDRLINRYGKCCLCGVSNKRTLIASHIKPWSESTESEKVDVDNGLLLCPNHDKLFDIGLISFDKNGQIIISDEIDEVNRMYLNVKDDMRIKMSEGNSKYMDYHRNYIFES